jgi:hypothetical protein
LTELVQKPRTYEDGTELGHAMNLCEQHSHAPSLVYPEGGTPREYDNGWDACYGLSFPTKATLIFRVPPH